MATRLSLQSSARLFVSLAVLFSYRINAEKVLLVPPAHGESHWLALAKVGQALVDKGHVVTVVLTEDIVDKRRAQWPYFWYEPFQDHGTSARLKVIKDSMSKTSGGGRMSLYNRLTLAFDITEEGKKYCELLLRDSSLVRRLKAAQYSVVITDPTFPCGALAAAYIDASVPHIAQMRNDPHFHMKATGVPMPPSYVPSLFTDFTDQMNFAQRARNVVSSMLLPMIARLRVNSVYGGLVQKYICEDETIESVMSRTDLWLFRTDHVLDFPRPSMPNMVHVGGLNVRAVDPLSKDMEAFVQSSGEDGVIVVSFGALFMLSLEQAEIFAAAFARLRQKVVWRYEGERPAGLGNNTKLLSWLPQNDLLGHPKTRAFVTHAGSNGMYEALHHGVPMVCLPLFADQHANAARVVARGLGVKLDFNTLTTDQLYEAILHVIANNSYRETAARLSRLHRDQPQSPMQRAVWWIEHVIRHGGLPLLRARAVDLPFYQYHLLDVAAFLLAVCSAVLGTVWCSCSLLCRKCCCKSRRGKPKSE